MKLRSSTFDSPWDSAPANHTGLIMASNILEPRVADPMAELNKYDFRTENKPVFKARKGVDREIVAQISEMKNEPAWMRFSAQVARDLRVEADAQMGRRR